jgi:hypothetical protein
MDIVGCCLSKAEGNISDQIKKKRNRMSKHMLLAAGQEAKVKDFFECATVTAGPEWVAESE